MKRIKENFKNYLTYSWYIVLLICLFSYVFSYYVVDYLTRYKDEEVFSLFVTSKEVINEELDDIILNKYKKDGIELVNIYNFKYNDKYISSYYENFGKKSDLLILYKSDLTDMKEYIDNEYMIIQNIDLSNYKTYSYNDKIYGIEIYSNNEDNNSYLSTYFNFNDGNNDSSYLLINKNSIHFKTNDSLGFNILNNLLKGEF